MVQVYAQGAREAVVQREANLLDLAEANKYPELVHKAMLDELQRFSNLGVFRRMEKKDATNIVDARWVLKWKKIDERCVSAFGKLLR